MTARHTFHHQMMAAYTNYTKQTVYRKDKCNVIEYDCTGFRIKTSSSDSWGQEVAACMCVFSPTQPLQWVIWGLHSIYKPS